MNIVSLKESVLKKTMYIKKSHGHISDKSELVEKLISYFRNNRQDKNSKK